MSEEFAGINTENLVPKPNTSFEKIKCECGNEQRVYSSVSSKVKCNVCGKQLAESTASKTHILTKETKPIEETPETDIEKPTVSENSKIEETKAVDETVEETKAVDETVEASESSEVSETTEEIKKSEETQE